jgi:hypothetical protein
VMRQPGRDNDETGAPWMRHARAAGSLPQVRRHHADRRRAFRWCVCGISLPMGLRDARVPPMDYLHKADARGSALGSDSMLVQFGGRRMATTPIPERSGQSSAGKCGIGQVDI